MSFADDILTENLAPLRRQLSHHPLWTGIEDGTLAVIEEHEAVINTLEEFIKRLGPPAARRLPIGLPHDREPTRDDLHNVPQGIVLIHFKIAERFKGP